jgi:hypothetical protein
MVNTESGTVSTVIDRTFVDNLPLNGRSAQFATSFVPAPAGVAEYTISKSFAIDRLSH